MTASAGGYAMLDAADDLRDWKRAFLREENSYESK